MIAAFFQFYHGPTAVTSLPPSLLGSFEKRICFLIFGAVFISVPFSIAQTADLCLASATLAIFLATLRVYISRFYPFTTPSRGAIYPVLCSIFLELLVP
jgi:hypothetical protein